MTSGCKGYNRYQQISTDDFNDFVRSFGKHCDILWSFSAVPEERSHTSFHGAGHIPWTMSSVPLSDGCKSPMKMHGTSSCGCASSVITSIESKRRLLSQAMAVVTTCDNSFRSSLLFLLVTTVLPMGKEQRVDYASHVRWMHHQDISRSSFHRCIDGQSCPWRRLKQEATIWKKSLNPIWWKRDICWCCSIPLCQGLIGLSDESAWVHNWATLKQTHIWVVALCDGKMR